VDIRIDKPRVKRYVSSWYHWDTHRVLQVNEITNPYGSSMLNLALGSLVQMPGSDKPAGSAFGRRAARMMRRVCSILDLRGKTHPVAKNS
jgi:hypothetical protein